MSLTEDTVVHCQIVGCPSKLSVPRSESVPATAEREGWKPYYKMILGADEKMHMVRCGVHCRIHLADATELES